MTNRSLKSLPVLMHHIISHDTSHICVPPPVFEAQCKALAEKGWFGIGLREAEEYLINGAPLPERSFLLTFDDGYLDNYVHAWPIMRKYGHKGVIFAIADRLSAAQSEGAAQMDGRKDLCRPTIEDVRNGTSDPARLPKVDSLLATDELGFTVRRDLFLNWDEARLLERSGDVAIAGHSMCHGSVFTGPGYTGFMRPGDRRRTFTQTTPESLWGMPNFPRGPELANRAFIPSAELVEAIRELVPQEYAAAADFFRSQANVASLETLVAGFRDRLGEMESDQAMRLRLRDIMQRTRDTLRGELGRETRSFCWPWGVFCQEAREEGLAAGFKVFYTTEIGVNRPGFPMAVHRFKVKSRTNSWLLGKVRLYSRPLLGSLYVKLRI